MVWYGGLCTAKIFIEMLFNVKDILQTVYDPFKNVVKNRIASTYSAEFVLKKFDCFKGREGKIKKISL